MQALNEPDCFAICRNLDNSPVPSVSPMHRNVRVSARVERLSLSVGELVGFRTHVPAKKHSDSGVALAFPDACEASSSA